MNQSKLESLAETILDMTLGFVTSALVWMYIAAPLVGVEGQAGQAIWVTALFTISSLARRYLTRRFFVNMLHKKVHIWVTKVLTKVNKPVE